MQPDRVSQSSVHIVLYFKRQAQLNWTAARTAIILAAVVLCHPVFVAQNILHKHLVFMKLLCMKKSCLQAMESPLPLPLPLLVLADLTICSLNSSLFTACASAPPPQPHGNWSFPGSTQHGGNVSGTCDPGYSGSMSAACNLGNLTAINNTCTPLGKLASVKKLLELSWAEWRPARRCRVSRGCRWPCCQAATGCIGL